MGDVRRVLGRKRRKVSLKMLVYMDKILCDMSKTHVTLRKGNKCTRIAECQSGKSNIGQKTKKTRWRDALRGLAGIT